MKLSQDLFMTEKKFGLMSEDNEKDIFQKFEFIPKDVYIMNIATTIGNTFLLSTSGKLYSWGKNCNALGRHCVQDIDAFKPQLIDIQSKIVEIAAGSNHAMALDENGQIFSWGQNNFGQLGDKNVEYLATAHQIKFFSSEPAVQIYAGGDSSYAITSKGDLYVWGDNRNQQLGVLGTFHNEPKQLVNTPWETSTREDRIVLSKDNVGYIFQPFIIKDSRAKEFQINDNNLLIEELNRKILQLEGQAKDTKGANDPEGKGGDKINNDHLLKNITQQLKTVNNEIAVHELEISELLEQIDIMTHDLANVKQELNEISRKENQLIGQRDVVDNKLRKVMRAGIGSDPQIIEDLQKDNKRLKELLQANDNIKNTLIKRQDETDDQIQIIQEQFGKSKKISEQQQQRQKLLIDMDRERKETIKATILGGNKVDIQRFVYKIYYFYKMMYETSISEIAKKENKAVGLEVMLEESNTKLNYIKNELSQFKVNTNDGIYELVQKIQEMAMDNLVIRMRNNDYIKALLMDVSLKNEDYLQSFQEQKIIEGAAFHQKDTKDKTISLFILKQKQKMTEMAKNCIDIKSYKKEVQKLSQASEKKRGCFG